MTSNLLAKIILSDLFQSFPKCKVYPPNQEEMLAENDACVLIGDIGMQAEAGNLYDVDLGEAWEMLTRLPFVWALWLGGPDLDEDLADRLREAMEESGLGGDRPGEPNAEFLAWAVEKSGWRKEVAEKYLLKTMHFRMDQDAWQGLWEFSYRARSEEIGATFTMPSRVGSQVDQTITWGQRFRRRRP
jgi:predicted solute-binding protein